MKPFPYPEGYAPGQVQFSCVGDNSSILFSIVDEGAGNFVEMSAEGMMRLDPDELCAIAAWCAETCKEMDEVRK